MDKNLQELQKVFARAKKKAKSLDISKEEDHLAYYRASKKVVHKSKEYHHNCI